MQDERDAYEITVAVDNGQLPSGNRRKTCHETARLLVEEAFDAPRWAWEILDTTLVSPASCKYGDTTWVVMVTVTVAEGQDPPKPDANIEDVELTAFEQVA